MRPPIPPNCILLCGHVRSRSNPPLISLPRRLFSRPSFAPKPILDIKHIIRNPGLYAQNCEDRNYKAAAQNAWKIHELSQQRAQIQNDAKDAREAYNKLKSEIERLQRQARKLKSKDIKDVDDDDGDTRTGGPFEGELSEFLAHAKLFKEDMSKVNEQEKEIEEEIQQLALALPNLSSVHTPTGEEPEVLEVVTGKYSDRNAKGTSHVDIGAELDILDFTSSATTSGWGFYFLKNEGALLEQALVQYTLDFLRRRGWTIVAPPSIVYSHIAAACGFQPRDANDEQQIYNLQQPTRGTEAAPGKPGLSLAATAEIPLAGMYAGKTIPSTDLPIKMAATSRCYRAEAGARGVDTKGLYRVHEFTKVEMFAWTLPDEHGDENFDTNTTTETAPAPAHSHSSAIFDEMVAIQQALLSSLGLSYRVLEMPTADLGGPASRKIDMEAFFPSRREIKDGGWGEVTSTSICTDYQSRRLGARVKSAEKGKGMEFPHTVNGTAMAVPRVLAAIMETGWDEDRRAFVVPEVLRGWMGGIERIQAKLKKVT